MTNNQFSKIGLALIMVGFLGNLNAQKLEISVYTEPQVAWITSDESRVISDGSVFKFNTGVEFDIFFRPNYAFTIGVEMNNQGGKMIYEDTIFYERASAPSLEVLPGSPVKHNLQYIGVPLGLKLKAAELGYTTFYFQGGLNPLFNLKAYTSSEQLSLDRENIQSEVHTYSLNYFVSVGLEYRLAGNTALMAGLKWSAGFNDVTENDLANNNLNSVGLHLGILF